ncbi:MAG: sulfotransferase [Deltaproteobacteria bacterium]|nr:sulfotransferase [Deltaproteobacteria bacterium]
MTHPLDPDALLSDARKASSLSDFGEPSFHLPMERLCSALRKEARLNEVGLATQRQRILDILVTRLRVEAFFAEQPEIADEKIGAPLVICGLPRTGTTLLHRVLAEDPGFDAALWYEVRYPAPFSGWEPGRPDARISAAKEEVRMTLELAPELMAIHPFDATSPDEEIMLLEHSFFSRTPESFCHLPEFSAWLDEQDQLPGYRYLLRLLQFLQWQHRQEGRARDRWVLKAPHHLGFLPELFTVFPDATVIQTHRDPTHSIASICSLCFHLETMGSDDPDPKATGAHWSAGWASYLNRAMAYRDAGHQEHFIDVDFLDTVRDPIACVERIYAALGRELTPIAEGQMRAWTEQNAREKRAAHTYSLEQFGLSEAGVARDFASYRARFC